MKACVQCSIATLMPSRLSIQLPLQVDSEQTNSALGLGVALDRDCNVKAAGGWMVQILPFCSEETLSQLETTLTTMPSVTQMLSSGMSPQDIADRILEGMGRAPDLTIIEPK